MQSRYIVTYDICDDGRRTAVYKVMRGFGDHLQYSVFRCDLAARELVELRAAVHPLLDHGADQVLIIDLGPVDGRGATCIDSIGRPYSTPERLVVVI